MNIFLQSFSVNLNSELKRNDFGTLRTLSSIERCAKEVLSSPVLLRHIFSSIFLPSSKDQGIIFESSGTPRHIRMFA